MATGKKNIHPIRPSKRAGVRAKKTAKAEKTPAPVSEKRCYRQYCGLAKALDAIGERWTLLIVRDLLLGPRRYGDILLGLDGITTNLLAARLKDMAKTGLVEKVRLTSSSGRATGAVSRGVAYTLTDDGRELEPVLLALGGWGWRFMEKPDPGDRRNLAWGLFSLKRRYRGVTRPVTAEMRVGDRVYQYRLEADYADLREGAPWMPDFHLRGEPDAFAELFFRGTPQAALVSQGRLLVSGSPESSRAFLDAFGIAA